MTRYITVKEASDMLRICPSSVRTLCDERKLACIRHKPNGKRLIPIQSVEQYLAALADPIESYQPPIVQFDDVERRMKERSERLRRAK